MTTPDQVLAQARRWIGTREGRGGNTYFSQREGIPGQPWCGAFVQVCLEDAGMRVTYNGDRSSEPSPISTVHGASRYKALGRYVSRWGAAKAGDIVFFDWGGSQSIGATDHVEIVEQVGAGDRLVTIGGNVSDAVMRKTRSRNQVTIFGRPLYSGRPTPPPPPAQNPLSAIAKWLEGRKRWAGELLPYVKGMPNMGPWDRSLHVVNLQRAINLVSGRGLVESGGYDGPTFEAVRDFQNFLGIKGDPQGFAWEHTRWMLSLAVQKIAEGRA